MDSKKLAKFAYTTAVRNVATDASKAFTHYLLALTLCPEWRIQMREEFLKTVEAVAENMLRLNRTDDMFKCYEEALAIYPDLPELKRSLANNLASIGMHFNGFTIYNSVFNKMSHDPLWQREIDDFKRILVDRYHFKMLNDKVRNIAYRKAILKCVNRDSVVLDIGCGSGLLTLYAGEKKPERLIAVEASEPMCNIASCVFKDADSINVDLIMKNSTLIQDENVTNKITVLITEIFDTGFFGEDFVKTMVHAKRKLMRGNDMDIIIPNAATLYVCGVQSESLLKRYLFYEGTFKESVQFGNMVVYANNRESYDAEDLTQLKDLLYITSVETFANIDFNDIKQLELLQSDCATFDTVNLNVIETGFIHAYVAWFDLHLGDENISTDPRCEKRSTAWDQAIFYVKKPKKYDICENIPLTLTCQRGCLEIIEESQDIVNFREYFPVSLNTIRMLNDSVFVKFCNHAVSTACIYLGQTIPYKNILEVHVLDTMQFPIAGFLLLTRGIKYLTCIATTDDEKHLIRRLCDLNGIQHSRIHFIEKPDDVFEEDNASYHVAIHDYITATFGEINIRHTIIGRGINAHRLQENGLMMPFCVRLMAKVIYSEDLELRNRVHNENVSDYNISDYMNVYTTSQIFVPYLSSLQHISMSDEIELIQDCLRKCGNSCVDFTLLHDGELNGVLTWFEVQMVENGDFYKTNVNGSYSNCAIYLLERDLVGVSNQKASLLMCINENGYLRIAVDLN